MPTITICRLPSFANGADALAGVKIVLVLMSNS